MAVVPVTAGLLTAGGVHVAGLLALVGWPAAARLTADASTYTC